MILFHIEEDREGNNYMQNQINDEYLSKIKINAKQMYDELDPELNKIVNEYLKEWKKKQDEIRELTGNFMSKIHNLKGYDINEEVLRCENINIETISSILNVENKYVSELVPILNTIARYKDAYQNTINRVIPHIALQIELKTHENGVINYLYSNLYDKLSNDEITNIIEEIKKGEVTMEQKNDFDVSKIFDIEGLEIKEMEDQITPEQRKINEERSLEEWLEIIDKKIAEIEESSKDDSVSTKENNSDKFVYKDGELKISNNQCELCIYNNESVPNKCKEYPNGKPQEVISNNEFCKNIKTTEKLNEWGE